MNDFDKILLTGSVTILGGFIFHSVSQLFLKLFVEPLQQYRQHKSEAISLLSFYSNMLSSQLSDCDSSIYQEKYYKAQEEIRLCMANIKASYYSITPRWLAILIGAIPNKDNFKKASNNLLTLSFLGSLSTETDKIDTNFNIAKETVKLLGAEW